MKVGFIGVGNMGGPMCRNIIRNTNHQVTVFDLNPDAVAACKRAVILRDCIGSTRGSFAPVRNSTAGYFVPSST